MTVRAEEDDPGRAAVAVALVRRADVEPVAAYGHLVSTRRPTQLAGAEEALASARTAELRSYVLPAADTCSARRPRDSGCAASRR